MKKLIKKKNLCINLILSLTLNRDEKVNKE